MIAKLKWIPVACVMTAMVLALPACPRQPPFDATGNYEGSWSGTIDNKAIVIADCPITMSFFQLVDFPIIKFRVVGTARLNWACVVPQEVLDFLGIEGQSITIPLIAVMGDDGSLSFEAEFDIQNIPAELVELLDLEGIADIPLQDLSFVLDAQGLDADSDGMMDQLSGSLVLNATFDRNGVLEPVGVDGTFDVQRTGV